MGSALTLPQTVEEEAVLASLSPTRSQDDISEGAPCAAVRPSTVWEEALAGPSGTELSSPVLTALTEAAPHRWPEAGAVRCTG